VLIALVIIALDGLVLVCPSHRTPDSGARLYDSAVFHDAEIEAELAHLRRVLSEIRALRPGFQPAVPG
jgi:hypothetical protein